MLLKVNVVAFGCIAMLSTVAGAEQSRTAFVPQNGWTTSHRIATAYATQAAAADRQHIYASSSTKVAKFERSSGELLATATSPTTKHLNSGYLYEGKLFCADSNYPSTPDESDIRVFDPCTNRLTVHPTFTDPPGSLVW